MFIDTHTHLFSEEFNDDRTEVIQRSIQSGVQKMLLPNIDEETVEGMYDLVAQFPQNCFAMMGIHPCSVKKDVVAQLADFKEKMNGKDFVAIGEIGIDMHWDKSTLPEQEIAFRTQIQWAKEFKLPIVIHARESFNEIFKVLDEENDEHLTGVFHCFTGKKEQIQKIDSYGGFKLGIGGVLTYKNAHLVETLKSTTLENIILETDSPYLSPVPFRGKRNESSYVLHVAEKLTEVFNVPLSEIEAQTTRNAEKLFPKIVL
jgi:TatD DNase family protein